MAESDRSTLPLTVTLRDGRLVLAKLYHGAPSALTYANRTQATAAARRVGGFVVGWRPFYVCLIQPEQAQP